ncbi:MAG: VWA domain-containing protein [Armatimonadetes bacterium]|nr:VWA domain-containing protein [Armatimonadota bacterium]
MTMATTGTTLPLLDLPDDRVRSGLGVLSVMIAEKRIALPLASLNIEARIADRIAEVTMTQVFQNRRTEHLEAVYTFPLPGGAAVSRFEMRVGDRVLLGKVEERGEARRQYKEAVEVGKRAALLEEERDDVFTVSVGNLPPGEDITLTITWSERLPFFEDGATEIRLPLVVAPRYIPGTPMERGDVGDGVEVDTDLVPDASRITPPRLADGFDPKVSLGISVEILGAGSDGRGGLEDLACTQHATRASTREGSLRITLAQQDERLNRDFILRWRLAGEKIRSSLLVHENAGKASYGMLSILPPRREGFLGNARDVVFVLDRSGSMEGVKMASASRACSLLLSTLGPRDRFAIEIFDNVAEWFTPKESEGSYFLQGDTRGIERGEKFLREVTSRGGTEMDGALGDARAAIAGRSEGEGSIPVIVLLTDGQIGDEGRVLKRLQKELGDTRVFTIGIDTAVNETFLRRLAAVGGGTATFVVPGEALDEALLGVGREIGNPLIVDLSLVNAGAGLESGTITPARMPDVFSGRAATVFFRLSKIGRVKVKGRLTDGGHFEEIVDPEKISLPALAQLWARSRVADLEDRFRMETGRQDDTRREIVDLAVSHSLLTRFTAFVVVDEAETVHAEGRVQKVLQPVEMPARWEMSFCPPPSPAPAACYDTMALAAAAFEPVEEELAQESGTAGYPAQGMPRPKAKSGPAKALHLFERIVKKEKPPTSSKTENKRIEEALRDYLKAVTDARAEIAAGKVPKPEPLEKARKALLEALADSDVGVQMPALQRFLRTEAVELVSALKTPGVSAGALTSVFERHEKTLEKAREEAAKALGRAASDRFWERTV